MNALESVSTRPYLIRALYDWCTDNGFTPYVAVQVDESVQVPREYVKDGEIVLNISFDATSSLKIGNQMIEFKARFAGTAREIMVPIERVIAIYARENGQGMAFPLAGPAAETGQAHRPVPVTSAPLPGTRDNRVVQLVAASAEPKDEAGGRDGKADQDEPPRPPGGGSPRPSLKRVK